MQMQWVIWGGAFGKWLGHGNGALRSGISDLIKEAWKRSRSPSSVSGYSEKIAICEPGSPPPNTRPAANLISDFPAYRTERWASVVWKPPSQCYLVIAALIERENGRENRRQVERPVWQEPWQLSRKGIWGVKALAYAFPSPPPTGLFCWAHR